MRNTTISRTILGAIFIFVVGIILASCYWVLFRDQLRPDDTVTVRFQSDIASIGRFVAPTTDGGTNRLTVSYADASASVTSVQPLTITIEPMPSSSPEALGEQVWLISAQTDQDQFADWSTSEHNITHKSWTPMVNGISGQDSLMYDANNSDGPDPLTLYMSTRSRAVALLFLEHPWSGAVRITINNDEPRVFELYSPVGAVKPIRLTAPRNLNDTIELKVPLSIDSGNSLRWFVSDREALVRVDSVRLTGTRTWSWKAGDGVPRLGAGLQLIENNESGLLLEVTDPVNAWIEWQDIPSTPLLPTTTQDWMTVLGLCGMNWAGMLILWVIGLLWRSTRLPVWGRAGTTAVVLLATFGLLAASILTTQQSNAQQIVHNDTDLFDVEEVVSELDSPTGIAFSPDGRMFIIEKGGFAGVANAYVKVLAPGETTPTTILELPVCSNAERGLTGIALDPDFENNQYVYLYYTYQKGECIVETKQKESTTNRLSRFTLVDNRLLPESEVVLVEGIPSVTGAHNAGGLRFGPDGKLYVGTGEGESGFNSQHLTSLGGKILRLDPHAEDIVPPDNPFANDPNPDTRLIWAYGLRNPYRFGIHPRTGMVLIGDVGSSPPRAREEINLGRPGANYGWPEVEGSTTVSGKDFVTPIYEYEHDGRCNSIIGGDFVTGQAYGAAYQDSFFFGDFSCGTVWSLKVDDFGNVQRIAQITSQLTHHPTHFDVGPDGLIYYADIGGSIWRIVPKS